MESRFVLEGPAGHALEELMWDTHGRRTRRQTDALSAVAAAELGTVARWAIESPGNVARRDSATGPSTPTLLLRGDAHVLRRRRHAALMLDSGAIGTVMAELDLGRGVVTELTPVARVPQAVRYTLGPVARDQVAKRMGSDPERAAPWLRVVEADLSELVRSTPSGLRSVTPRARNRFRYIRPRPEISRMDHGGNATLSLWCARLGGMLLVVDLPACAIVAVYSVPESAAPGMAGSRR